MSGVGQVAKRLLVGRPEWTTWPQRSPRCTATSSPWRSGLVLVVVLATKFLAGAWIVVVAMPLLFQPGVMVTSVPWQLDSAGPHSRGAPSPSGATVEAPRGRQPVGR